MLATPPFGARAIQTLHLHCRAYNEYPDIFLFKVSAISARKDKPFVSPAPIKTSPVMCSSGEVS